MLEPRPTHERTPRAAGDFFELLDRALVAIERDVPRAYAALYEQMVSPIRLTVDARTQLIGRRGARLRLSEEPADTASRDALVELTTQRRTVERLVEGDLDLLEALRDDALLMRGAVGEIARAYDALMLFLRGAVRSPELPGLLDAYLGRPAAADSVPQRQGEPMPEESRTPPLKAPETPPPVLRDVSKSNLVTIFGAGIAGLTVAHELVERGFRVQVWEPAQDPRAPGRGVEVGGMARTQWASVPWHEQVSVSKVPETSEEWTLEHWDHARATPILHLPQKFMFSDEPKLIGALGEFGDSDAATVITELVSALRTRPEITEIYCEVFDQRVRKKQQSLTVNDREDLAKKITAALRVVLKQAGLEGLVKIDKDPQSVSPYKERLNTTATISDGKDEYEINIAVIDLDDVPEGIPADYHVVLGFRPRLRYLPGEHGFRFFPSFYYHLFDTMKRTPILEPVAKLALGASQERSMTVNANRAKYTETGRTVYDNLHPTSKQAVGFPRKAWPGEFKRSLPSSFEEVLQWLRFLHERRRDSNGAESGFGFSPRDTMLMQLKLLQFLTSSEARRAEYEQMTWLQFLGGEDAFSQEFANAIKAWPEALVAMDATEADARTQGAVLSQLLLDNLRPLGYRDGTLNGPTSEAWLKHWRRYLEAQGVEFIHGKLEGFRVLSDPDGQRVVWPKVSCYEPRYHADGKEPPLYPGFFVLALPAQPAQRMAREYVELVGSTAETRNPDLWRLARQQGLDGADLHEAKPDGQLRHMVGIQYYFDEDISWLDGHAYFPDSTWGLTSISQVRFWLERHDWEHGYRGILSVVVSILDEPESAADGTKAWKTEPAAFAQEVWKQISSGVRQDVPQPRYWHLDQGLEWKGDRYHNETPYQINLAGAWEGRPGDLRKSAESYYSTGDGIVCAGTYMKTFTRLTTMESANESARHAVNAILGACGSSMRKSPCEIWPLEEREVDDLRFLKELDAELYRRGLDHFLQIVGAEELLRDGLRGGPDDPFDPLGALSRLRTLAVQFRRNLDGY